MFSALSDLHFGLANTCEPTAQAELAATPLLGNPSSLKAKSSGSSPDIATKISNKINKLQPRPSPAGLAAFGVGILWGYQGVIFRAFRCINLQR